MTVKDDAEDTGDEGLQGGGATLGSATPVNAVDAPPATGESRTAGAGPARQAKESEEKQRARADRDDAISRLTGLKEKRKGVETALKPLIERYEEGGRGNALENSMAAKKKALEDLNQQLVETQQLITELTRQHGLEALETVAPNDETQEPGA